MKRYIRELPGQKEVIEVPDDPNVPIDISDDPEKTTYSFDSFEDYQEFCERAKLK